MCMKVLLLIKEVSASMFDSGVFTRRFSNHPTMFGLCFIMESFNAKRICFREDSHHKASIFPTYSNRPINQICPWQWSCSPSSSPRSRLSTRCRPLMLPFMCRKPRVTVLARKSRALKSNAVLFNFHYTDECFDLHIATFLYLLMIYAYTIAVPYRNLSSNFVPT